MKKFLSIILTAVFILSVFSFNSFAAETTKTEQWINNNINPVEVGMNVTINDENNTTIYIKDKMIAGTVPLFENLKVNIIAKDNCLYLYLKYLPFFHIKFENVTDEVLGLDTVKPYNLTFVESYDVTISSQKYFVEQFITKEEETIKYYFLEDELKFIVADTYQNGYPEQVRIEILTTDVDEKVFELPFFSIDVTRFLELIFGNIFLFV